jgi:AraC-like DNA-binding protein
VTSSEKIRTSKEHGYVFAPPGCDGILVLKARFHHFAYTRHTHPEFAIGVVEQGIAKCYYQGRMQIVPPGEIITVNPGEVHTGEVNDAKGYRYRVAYIPQRLMAECLYDGLGIAAASAHFPKLLNHDPHLSLHLLQALHLFEEKVSPGERRTSSSKEKISSSFEAKECFFQALGELLMRHGHPHSSPSSLKGCPSIVRKARDFIHDMAAEPISLEDIASAAGVSRFHFLRLFKTYTGLSPHAYLIQYRVELAKHSIKAGKSLAAAAMDSGFFDQSHMSRRFKAVYGITPGQYQAVVSRP